MHEAGTLDISEDGLDRISCKRMALAHIARADQADAQ
jgi:DNA-directed RNA polymerase subunit N (RpoN/RPB10)